MERGVLVLCRHYILIIFPHTERREKGMAASCENIAARLFRTSEGLFDAEMPNSAGNLRLVLKQLIFCSKLSSAFSLLCVLWVLCGLISF